MVGLRRFGPLITAVFLVFGVITLRLFEVQVVEHEVWAREAANLVRSWTIEPYRRGTIRDRRGRPLVRDEEAYEVEFRWRDFRRGHPLGQVAQARSLLTQKPVTLVSTLANFRPWALELCQLTPRAIDAFGRGAGVEQGTLVVAPTDEPERERRWARSGDLHFYVQGLLGLDRRAQWRIGKLRGELAWGDTYLELAADQRGLSIDLLAVELDERIARAERHLALFAPLAREGGTATEGALHEPSLEQLVAKIEAIRTEVENKTADDLFRKAAGFEAWRLDAWNLSRIDLDWLRLCLYWDEERLYEWMRERGNLWPLAVQEYIAGHAIARFKVGTAEPGTRVVSALAHVFAPPELREGVNRAIPGDWRRVDGVVALAGLAERAPAFELGQETVLPFQEVALRDSGLRGAELLESLFSASDLPRPVPEVAEDLLALANRARPTWDAEELEVVRDVLLAWDARLQSEAALRLDVAAPESEGEQLALGRPWVQIATEERAYVVRDRSARPVRLWPNPPYELVHLITRFPRRYAGFNVRVVTRRRAVALDDEPEPRPIAAELIGRVRSPYLARLLEQRESELELSELQRKLDLTEADRPRILAIVSDLFQGGEAMGGTGIEGYFDRELSGTNGYRETQGLQDRKEGNRDPIYELPQDGEDLDLTLDLNLQRLAQRVLERPAPVPSSEERPDRVWWQNPVGALVLVTPEGDVLAAASVPTKPGTPGLYQDGQRAVVIDRTLRQPIFHPPGSVFKPFVAAWALQYLGLDPEEHRVNCIPELGEEHPSYEGGVHCWRSSGHQENVGLAAGLIGSCNVYFAYLGANFFVEDEFRAMATRFGFGRPTGVKSLGGERAGLIEQTSFGPDLETPGKVLHSKGLQRLGNGLTHITAVPMQVARAYAGLATGSLPELRLVRASGQRTFPQRSEPLPIEPRHLARIHGHLESVVSHGTAANKGLGEEDLGFRFAAKTGSADYKAGSVPIDPRGPLVPENFEPGVRKHTWVSGWFPADEPRAILVVYVHDTSTTASHSAAHIAAQFLEAPEIAAYLASEGVR